LPKTIKVNNPIQCNLTGVGLPLCSPIVLDATVHESPITLHTTCLMPQPCVHLSKSL